MAALRFDQEGILFCSNRKSQGGLAFSPTNCGKDHNLSQRVKLIFPVSIFWMGPTHLARAFPKTALH